MRRTLCTALSLAVLASALTPVEKDAPRMLTRYSACEEIPQFSAPAYAHLVPANYKEAVRENALRYDVPEWFLARLLYQETKGTWRADIVSARNADGTVDKGLSQANSKYLAYFAEEFGLTDPFNAEQSIAFAARYSRFLFDFTGTWFGTGAAYKMGLTAYLRAPVNVPIRVYMDVIWIIQG